MHEMFQFNLLEYAPPHVQKKLRDVCMFVDIHLDKGLFIMTGYDNGRKIMDER